MPPVLLDTNILIYYYDHNSPPKQASAGQVLDRLYSVGLGRLSAQVLAEFVNASLRKLDPPLTPAQVLDQLAWFTTSWPVFDLTPQVILEATRGIRDHKLSYYDAQIWASARLNQVPLVLTEDFQDGQILEGVRFVNPFSATFDLESWL